MAIFDLRLLLNKLYAEPDVSVGGTSEFALHTDFFVASATHPGFDPEANNILLPGAHTITLASGDRVLAGDIFAFQATNPDTSYGYKSTDIFSFTLNINGILSSAGNTIYLQNSRTTSANIITVGKDGVVGGDDAAIFTEGKTTITNNGLITSYFEDGFGGTFGDAIVFDGDVIGSNLNAASATTITNNLGAAIVAGQNAIRFDSLGSLTVANKGIISGMEADKVNVNDGGAIVATNSKVTLTNEVGAIMDGTVRVGWLSSAVTNKGDINGTISADVVTELDGLNKSTGWVDFDRDGAASSTDLGDKHWNTIGTTVVMTVTNTAIINGTDNWDNNGGDVEVALDLSHGKDVVTNTGIIYGLIRTSGGSDSVTNNALSKIYGDLNLGTADLFSNYTGLGGNIGTGGKYALDDDTVMNKGLIAGGVFTDMGKDIITNNGEIQGSVEIGTGNYDAANAKDEDYDTLTNTGLIGGNVWTGLGDDIVTNSGRINDGLNTSAWPGQYDGVQWNWKNDTVSANKLLDDDKDTVTNTGTINGGVETGHGADKVTNSNLIDGDLETGIWNWIGDPDSGNPYTVVDLAVFQADDNDTVDNKGTVSGEIGTGLGADTVNNSGSTKGIYTSDNNRTKTVDPGGPNETTLNIVIPLDAATYDKDTVTNTGFVQDGIWTGVGDDKIYNKVGGRVGYDGIYADDGADIVENNAIVLGDVSGGQGGDTITNTGTIRGNVFLGLDVVDNKLINKFLIEGDVVGDNSFVAAEGNNTIDNSGTILGDVLLGGGTDKVTNLATGRIEGEIKLGGGVDQYIGNATFETIVDEGGGDTYKMGAGDDTVIYGLVDGTTNTMDGEAGVDSIDFGNLSNDAIVNLSNLTAQTVTFSGPTQNDNLKNFENVYAGSGNDTIVGSAVTNDIQGGDGNDKITGGKGQDFLEGGNGQDTFIYAALDDSLAGLADIIFDFDTADDSLDLTFITGSLTEITGSGAFSASSVAAAQWRQTFVGGNTIIEINADADLAADMVIYLSGNVNLLGADFV